jgi:hypothetical protein
MQGNYEVRRQDGLKCHDIHTKSHKYLFRHSEVIKGGGGDTQAEWRSHKSMLGKWAVFSIFQCIVILTEIIAHSKCTGNVVTV